MDYQSKRYPFVKVLSSAGSSRIHVELLETSPRMVKAITKKYDDGRILSLHVVDDVVIEKSLTYALTWDYTLLKKE
jgi:hypothetical protein